MLAEVAFVDRAPGFHEGHVHAGFGEALGDPAAGRA